MTMSRGKKALEYIECQRLRVGSKKSAQQGRRLQKSGSRRARPLLRAERTLST